MSWLGYDEWEAPEGYVDISAIWPVWEQEDSLIIFWIGCTLDSTIFRVFSQRCEIGANATLTPDGGVNLIATLDSRVLWKITGVQRLDNGGFGVRAQWFEQISG